MDEKNLKKVEEEDSRIIRKMKNLELPEYRHIPWLKDFSCPECGKSEWRNEGWRPRPIGWCNTPEGYMCIFERPECFNQRKICIIAYHLGYHGT